MVKPLEELADALSKLPTIGRKSAWRLALHLLERDQHQLTLLAEYIGNIKKKVKVCSVCFNYSEADVCEVCSSSSRDKTLICVVEKPTDVFTIEKSGRYRGVYHVLGGVLSPINGVTANKLRIEELKNRIAQDNVVELIMGLGASAEAETTSLYLARLLSSTGVRITRFARGLPAGMDLEYVDQLTLTQALNERTSVEYGR